LANANIACDDIFAFEYCDKVISKDKDGNDVERTLTHLSSNMKQSIISGVKQDAMTLKAIREQTDLITGDLKFKKEVNCIPLREYNNTFYLYPNGKVRIQKNKQKIRVSGIEQITENVIDPETGKVLLDSNKKPIKRFIGEITCGKLIKRPDGYYIMITIYFPKKELVTNGKTIGLDFGISTNITA
jgi:transposase